MGRQLEKFIRIQRAQSPGPNTTELDWHTIANCSKLPVRAMAIADTVEADGVPSSKRFYFHIAFVDGIAPGNRVTYLSQLFSVLEVSDSNRLQGLELGCEPIEATSLA